MTRTMLLLLSFTFILSACYRMPEDGEVSTVPNTNNPHMTGQDRQPVGIPGLGI